MRKIVIILPVLIVESIVLVTAHGTNHAEHVETDLITLVTILLSAVLTSVVPLVVGFIIFLKLNIRFKTSAETSNYLQAFSFGAVVFLLFDYASLSSIFTFQKENLGFQTQKFLIVIAILIIFGNFVSKSDEGATNNVFHIWAIGIFVHTIGEGVIMGFNFVLGFREALAPLSITSFIMHKVLEGGVAASLLLEPQNSENSAKPILVMILAGLAIIPGVLLGYLAGRAKNENFVNDVNILSFTVGFAVIVFTIPFLIPKKSSLLNQDFFVLASTGLMYMYISLILHEI